MSVEFLDTRTALRRFEAISVGDGAPFTQGQVVDIRDGDILRIYIPPLGPRGGALISTGYPIMRGHYWTGEAYKTHQRDREWE